MNKTDTIKAYLAKYPNLGPKDLAVKISEETAYPTIGNHVSQVKSLMGKQLRRVREITPTTPAVSEKKGAETAARLSAGPGVTLVLGEPGTWINDEDIRPGFIEVLGTCTRVLQKMTVEEARELLALAGRLGAEATMQALIAVATLKKE